MDIETFTQYCGEKLGAEASFPFGPDTLVFKVRNKIFAITGLDNEIPSANLKCSPSWSVELREQYDEITPGYHMNKTHWNTVILEGMLSDQLIKKLIDYSYELVVGSLPKKEQAILKSLQDE